MRRIYVTGTSPAAALLAEHLAATAGVSVVTSLPQRSVTIDAGDVLAIDSVDSPLERQVEAQLEEIAATHGTGSWVKHRAAGNRSPRAMVVTTPDIYAEHVARAVYFALLKEMGHGRRAWWRRALGLALLLLVAVPAGAQDLGTNRRVSVTGGAGGSTATTATGTANLDGETVVITDLNGGTVSATITNAANDGTPTPEWSGDGTSWQTALCHDTNNLNNATSTLTSDGIYVCNVGGMKSFRVRNAGGTTGTVTITLRATQDEGVTQTRILTGGLPISTVANPVIVKLRDGANNNIASSDTDPVGTERGLFVRNIPGTTEQTVMQPTGSNLHIVCDSGCGSPPATADSSAFTFGTTSVSPIAFVVDDTATNTVAENSFGAPRMSTNRVLYVDLSKTTSNATAIKVDGSAVTQPVSGTVGVSNFPATQAVTQSGAWSVGDGGGSLTVDGTFWQATQPISSVAIGATGAAAPTSAILVGMSSSATGNLIAFPNAIATPGAATTGLVVREAARGQNTMSASIPVTLASDQSALTISGTVTSNVGTGTRAVNQTQINGVTVASGMGVSGTDTQRVTMSQELTYSAGTTAKTATAAGTAPFFNVCGSGTKTIRVQRISVAGTVATAAVWGDIVIKKTSSAATGGTATTLTNTPYDSTSAAGTATAKYFTVLPTAGTSVGVIFTATQLFPVTAISATLQPTPAPLVYLWRDQDAEAPTLRGTAQCLEMSFGTTTTNAPTLTVSVAWTEK